MTRFMFRALNELKSDIIVVDKLLETPSTANYSKGTHRITNACMQNMSLLLLYITILVACWCSQLYARATNLIQQSQSQNYRFQVNRKWEVYIDWCIIHCMMYHTSYDVSFINWTQCFYLITQLSRYVEYTIGFNWLCFKDKHVQSLVVAPAVLQVGSE